MWHEGNLKSGLQEDFCSKECTSLSKGPQNRQANHRVSGENGAQLLSWLKEVLFNSDIDTDKVKAHSYRSAAVSAAFSIGCSLDLILKTADWSSENWSSENFICERLSLKIWQLYHNLLADKPMLAN